MFHPLEKEGLRWGVAATHRLSQLFRMVRARPTPSIRKKEMDRAARSQKRTPAMRRTSTSKIKPSGNRRRPSRLSTNLSIGSDQILRLPAVLEKMTVHNNKSVTGTLRVRRIPNPFAEGSLTSIGNGIRVSGPSSFAQAFVWHLPSKDLEGIDARIAKVFKLISRAGAWEMIEPSGINATRGFIWACLTSPGDYGAVGAPTDWLLRAMITKLAHQRDKFNRKDRDRGAIVKDVLGQLLVVPNSELEAVRRFAARRAVSAGIGPNVSPWYEDRGGTIGSGLLPKSRDTKHFKQRLKMLKPGSHGLPEEELVPSIGTLARLSGVKR